MNSGPNALSYYLRLLWDRRPRRTVTVEGGYRVQFEHPTQLLASTFLRALGSGDTELVWSRLSSETHGLLEGQYATRAGLPLHLAAGVADDVADARLALVVGPLIAATSVPGLGTFGVSAARLVDRTTAYVLLLRDFPEERIVREDEWQPAHLLAFVRESGEWHLDLGRTFDCHAAVRGQRLSRRPPGDRRIRRRR